MATPEQVKNFIKRIAPIAQAEYAKGKLILPSVCIAQACTESAYGTTERMINANAIMGIKVGTNKVHFGTAWKDKAYNTATKECYDGKTYTKINDFFRAYDSIELAIEDYYDLLCSCTRYKTAVGETDYTKAITAIKSGGYATALDYIKTICSIIRTNNLTMYDATPKTSMVKIPTTPTNILDETKKAVEYMLTIALDDSHGYDQIKRWGKDYDCSSLTIEAWEKAGIPVKTKGASYTGNMRKVFLANGFDDVTKQVNLTTAKDMQYGDILLKEGSHVATYIGNGQIVHASINEKGTTTNGKTGDQTGNEICIRSYYNKPWNAVLRFKGNAVNAHKQTLKSEEEIAAEVLAGKWGSGADRKARLEKSGYNYQSIQNRVNIMGKTKTTKIHKVVLGDTLTAIASKYGTTVNEIIKDNIDQYPKIKPNFVVLGWVLRV